MIRIYHYTCQIFFWIEILIFFSLSLTINFLLWCLHFLCCINSRYTYRGKSIWDPSINSIYTIILPTRDLSEWKSWTSAMERQVVIFPNHGLWLSLILAAIRAEMRCISDCWTNYKCKMKWLDHVNYMCNIGSYVDGETAVNGYVLAGLGFIRQSRRKSFSKTEKCIYIRLYHLDKTKKKVKVSIY